MNASVRRVAESRAAVPITRWVLCTGGGYLLGAVPVAVLVARRDRFDPRITGDDNAGFWNVKSQVGWRRSLPVLLGDTAKGAAAAATGMLVTGSPWGAYLAGGAAMIGHAWPVFAGFRGGKSILTFAGAMLVVSPPAAALSLGVLTAATAVTHSFAAGVVPAVTAFPLLQLLFDPPLQVAATGAMLTFIGGKFLLDAGLRRRRQAQPGA